MPYELKIFIEVVIFLLGLAIGSFFNVCIYRIPREESVVSPPSHCPACGRQISWWQNIPVFSYLFLRGRCYFCKISISPRYMLVELLTGILFLAVYLHSGWQPATICWLIFVSLLIPIIFIDLDHQIIPDRFSLSGIVLGFVCSLTGLTIPWGESALGIIVGGGVLWLIAEGYYRFTGRDGMGGGDVKLLAMIGAFLGSKAVLVTIFLSAFLGSAVGVAFMIFKGKGRKYAIPYGPFLALGAITCLFWGDSLVAWYQSLLYLR